MPRLTIEELQKLREKARETVTLREGGQYRAKINVHMGTCGIAAGAREIMSTVIAEIEQRDLKDVLVTNSGCAGLCSKEPMATVELTGHAPVKYIELTPQKTKEIIDKHVVGGQILAKYALGIGSEKTDLSKE